MSDLIGRKLGKYTLIEKLGEGGMAMVFRSLHPQFNRPVAIKILPPTVGQDPSFRDRFEREGRTIAGLNHPNIVRIYDIDESDGLFYMVMDLLPGGTLEARLREGGLDRKWSADVVVKMAEALEYAHTHGVIHRDIKPSNILLDADAHPVLADFGIAKLVQGEGDPGLTSAGMVMGTPAYMAPEQLTGQLPDARADIYSLGVVLYQLLAGRAPFSGDTMAIVSAHLTKLPPSPREYVPDLPAALDAVVLQALAKQPEHRFKSAGVFAQALRNAAVDLEPGVVRVVSAAPDVPAPTFNDVVLPRAAPAAQNTLAAPQQPLTTGQQVTRYMPIVLGVLGLLLLISLIAKYWALVVLLLVLIGGGGFAFMYFRARVAGRKAAVETTRAISTSMSGPSRPPAAQEAPDAATDPLTPTASAQEEIAPPSVTQAALAPQSPSTRPLDDHDDVPEIPVSTPDASAQGTVAAALQDLPPTEAVSLAGDDATEAVSLAGDDATEAVSLAGDDATEAVSLAGDDATEAVSLAPPAELPPTEAVSLAPPAELPPTEAIPRAGDDTLAPTETLPISPSDAGNDKELR